MSQNTKMPNIQNNTKVLNQKNDHFLGIFYLIAVFSNSTAGVQRRNPTALFCWTGSASLKSIRTKIC